jgi:hypothetical protein
LDEQKVQRGQQDFATMLASVDRKFVLLSNPKSGSTALEAAYTKFAEFKVNGNPKWKHINYKRFKTIFGDFFESRQCTIYVVVRHPIDRVYSWYRYRSRSKIKNPNHRSYGRYTGNISFQEFVNRWGTKNPSGNFFSNSQRSFICDKDGNIPNISIYRYEDIARLNDRLSTHVGQPVVLPRVNQSPKPAADLDLTSIDWPNRMREELKFYETIPFA